MILLMLFLVFTPVNMYAKLNEIYKNVYVNKNWSIAGKPAEDIFKGCGTNSFEVR